MFRSACNVTSELGCLVTVIGCHVGNVAHGIRLACDPEFDSVMTRGMAVRFVLDGIHFEDAVRPTKVCFSAARTWRPELRPGRYGGDANSLHAASQVRNLLSAQAYRSASDFLRATLKMEAGTGPLGILAAAVLPRLAFATRSGDGGGVMNLLEKLVGAGPGLTPAGDDFIVGWLAGLTLIARTPVRLAFLNAICGGVKALASATTSVSAQHLSDAAALMFSERLSDLGVAIAAGAPQPVLSGCVRAQLSVGASSGADAAAGLIFALYDCGDIV